MGNENNLVFPSFSETYQILQLFQSSGELKPNTNKIRVISDIYIKNIQNGNYNNIPRYLNNTNGKLKGNHHNR